jgi:hypothetical protein
MQYVILKNIPGYDGLYVCFKTEIKMVALLPELSASEIIAFDKSLEEVRKFIPDGFNYHKGDNYHIDANYHKDDKEIDPIVVEMWENHTPYNLHKNKILFL